MANMEYEDTLIQESTGEGGGWALDRTEATADWFDSRDEENSGEDVCVPASPEPSSFPEWLEKHNDHLKLPDSFREWLDRNQDEIISDDERRRKNRDEAYRDQGHLHT